MSEEVAMADNATKVINGDETATASAPEVERAREAPSSEPDHPQIGGFSVECKVEPADALETEPTPTPVEAPEPSEPDADKRGVKRRASAAFSDEDKPVVDKDFKGFEFVEQKDVSLDYGRVLERLEAEVEEEKKSFTPVRTIRASLPSKLASKRPRQDTDGSRPSSGLSSRSDGESAFSGDGAHSSPMSRGRKTTTEIGSPAFRVPLERGWRRELVYRAALDAHSRRNADIYYYTPKGKKLRSTREVAEHLSGTGLTLENFSFFKEPLGVDDPEKEIIRDAKLMRKMDSPVQSPAPTVEGKRAPKPKAPKGATELPSPPAKIKVKSMGSRLSGSGPSPANAKKKAATDNNNSAAWKKPRQPPPAGSGPLVEQPRTTDLPVSQQQQQLQVQVQQYQAKQTTSLTMQVSGFTAQGPILTVQSTVTGQGPVTTQGTVTGQGSVTVPSSAQLAPPPPPLQSRPPPVEASPEKPTTQLVPACSLTCGRGVPTLACSACLCLYHPACALYSGAAQLFTCKNCRKGGCPPLLPPPLLHRSAVPRAAAPAQRVLLRMKVASGGPDGERVWAVAKPTQLAPKPTQPAQPAPKPAPIPTKPAQAPKPPPKPAQAPKAPVKKPQVARLNPLSSAMAVRSTLPQSLAVINGRRFIVVPRSMVQPSTKPEDKKRVARLSNGAASPPEALAARRRTRGRDDTDYFTPFYTKAKENNYNVVVQIFQYLGMRDLAHAARVCRLWREMAQAPQLWKHVRMKNSHVSDWGGLCAALRRHGTRRLDLRKLLLPAADETFWDHFATHIATVPTIERIEMCRCPARAVEAVCRGLPGLRSLSALAIRDALLDPSPLGTLSMLHELRLKSMAGLSLTRDLRPLTALKCLQHLSLTSIKELGWCCSDVVGQLEALESLELGECTFRAEFASVLAKLRRLRRLRLERGTAQCAAPALLRALSTLPLLTRLELINIDIKVGFDDALAECKNIQRLLIIPTYVSQSATTNRQVLSGVLRLKDTLTHLMWGVTIELLRVTELFIDQCEKGERPARDVGECIPVLKPVPGCKLPDHTSVQGPPQVEILPLPTLQRLLSAQMPTTKLKLLRIPFHATWRQSLADFQ